MQTGICDLARASCTKQVGWNERMSRHPNTQYKYLIYIQDCHWEGTLMDAKLLNVICQNVNFIPFNVNHSNRTVLSSLRRLDLLEPSH